MLSNCKTGVGKGGGWLSGGGWWTGVREGAGWRDEVDQSRARRCAGCFFQFFLHPVRPVGYFPRPDRGSRSELKISSQSHGRARHHWLGVGKLDALMRVSHARQANRRVWLGWLRWSGAGPGWPLLVPIFVVWSHVLQFSRCFPGAGVAQEASLGSFRVTKAAQDNCAAEIEDVCDIDSCYLLAEDGLIPSLLVALRQLLPAGLAGLEMSHDRRPLTDRRLHNRRKETLEGRVQQGGRT